MPAWVTTVPLGVVKPTAGAADCEYDGGAASGLEPHAWLAEDPKVKSTTPPECKKLAGNHGWFHEVALFDPAAAVAAST